jgi:FkbM family methyltransferase
VRQVEFASRSHSAAQALRALRVLAKQAVGIEPRIPTGIDVPLEFHGNESGGWCTVAGALRPDSVVVDVGLGEDVSFSESIIHRYGCIVYGFDPTPRAAAYVRGLRNDRLKLFELGVGPSKGKSQFFLPSNRRYVSGSIALERHLDRHGIEVDVVTIEDVFQLLGCPRIDLLKLDIEGTEYDVIESPAFRTRSAFINQLCVEFHHRWQSRGKRSTERAAATLRSLGFSCAWSCRSTNEEYLFVRGGSVEGVLQ